MYTNRHVQTHTHAHIHAHTHIHTELHKVITLQAVIIIFKARNQKPNTHHIKIM